MILNIVAIVITLNWIEKNSEVLICATQTTCYREGIITKLSHSNNRICHTEKDRVCVCLWHKSHGKYPASV